MKRFLNKKGFTVIELIIVVPLIVVIIIIAYNMFFLTTKSFSNVNNNFNTYEDLRSFLINIQREVNQAKKAEESKDVLHRVDQRELHIYTDVDNDNIPELIRYRLEENKLIKELKEASNSEYPYEFTSPFTVKGVVLSNVINTEIFDEVKTVKAKSEGHGENYNVDKDYRRKVKMRVEISVGENNNRTVIETYLLTKSRAKYD